MLDFTDPELNENTVRLDFRYAFPGCALKPDWHYTAQVDQKEYTQDLQALGSHTDYPTRPDISILECFPNPSPGSDYSIRFDCPEFTSMCPVTGQPDYGRFEFEYEPDELCLESKSLKLYLFSFRNEAAFWEELSNRIADYLFTLLKPHSLRLTGYMNPRGAISITTTVRRGRSASER